MPRTPDYFPGEREEEALLIVSGSDYPAKNGEITYVSGSGFKFYEEGSLRTLTTSSIDASDHAKLRQLIHLADGGGPFEGFASGAVCDQGPSPFPTASIWYTDASRTQIIVSQAIVYNNNKTIATEQWVAYGTNGLPVAVVTDNITYQGVFETSRTRTIFL